MGIRLRPVNKEQVSQVEEEVKEQPQENNEEMIEGMLSKNLTQEERMEYKQMLQKFPNLFVKDYINVRGVDIVQHQIELKPESQPRAQKLRRLGVVKEEALLKEVRKLLLAGFIYPVDNLEWVSPVVVTPKKNGILTYRLHEKVIKVPNVKPLPPPPPKVLSNAYTLFFDGAFRRATGKAGGGLVLVNPEGEVVMKEQVTLDGSTSNNEAEYDILISGLKICLAQKIQRLMVKGDALLIVKQILGIWACKNERLKTKVTSIRKLFSQFEEVQLYHIPRKENEDADLLAQQVVSNQDKAHVVIAAIALKDPQYAVIANGPFEKWGIDAMGPLPRTANEKLYILVAIDYMTRFGTLLEIVSDNGPGFRRDLLTEEMVESKPKRWNNFLDGAIWAYRTTYRDATQFTPFHLVYGQEALQPIELNIPTIKLTGRQEQNNDEAWIDRLLNLVELEWKREVAYHCYEKKALQLKDKLNEGIKDKEIKEKSLVLRYNNALDNRFDAKFERRWEGPFIVKKDFTGGYYQLMDLNGKEHPRKVNGYRLKPYLSRILPAIFETKQVSMKTEKVCCHCCSGTHQVKSCAFQHVLHEIPKNQKEKLSSPTSCSESSFQYDPVDGT
ncbi:hypothetical protein L7F22_021523 [Adiantum nelumboides]|nr:hypothetical protein [Adiantum nelumboides]